MQARGTRDKVILFTKVGMDMGAGKGLSAKWIAEEVGYRDRFFFSKDFKRLTGFTPREFRRRAHFE